MNTFVICDSCLALYCLAASLKPCGHLLGKSWPFGSLLYDVLFCFVTFRYGVLVKLCYLILSIPDLCLLPYLDMITLIS